MAALLYEHHPLRVEKRCVEASTWPDRGDGGCCGGSTTEPDGDYTVTLREVISSPNASYDVLERLGRGTFGQVVKCWRKESNEIVAIKILKSTPSYAKQGQMEVEVLSMLSSLSAEEGSFVRAYESFQHCGHICIVFELLHTNLYDYLKQTRFEPLPLKYIRPIAQQVLCCLEKLSSLQLVHADLKPENIMLVDPQRFPFKVKVIDFGSAMSRKKATPSCYLQSRYYRAPEVIMGVPFNESIDMWSLGCVLAELYLGWPLFPGSCEFNQIMYICETLGAAGLNGLPSCLMRNSNKSGKFFNCDPKTRTWSLKPVSQYTQETGIQSKESRRYILHSLLDLAQIPSPSTNTIDNQESLLTSLDRMEFISLLSRMLTLDPTQRITPSAALQMPFITMQHLAMHIHSPAVWGWIQAMQVCKHAAPSAGSTMPTLSSSHPAAVAAADPTSPSSCHLHLLTTAGGTTGTAAAIQPPLFYPVIPQTHLVCHIAPSTVGYLPLAAATVGGSVDATAVQLKHHPQPAPPTAATTQIISPWLDPRTCQAAAYRHTTVPPPQQVGNSLIFPDPHQLPTVAATPTSGHPHQFHVNHIDAASQIFHAAATTKLHPLQLPAYHPFSRL